MAEERIDIIVSQKGATEVKRDLESIGQGARASIPALKDLQSAIQRITNLAQISAGPVSHLNDAMNLLGIAAAMASLNIQKLGPATDIVISKFNDLWAVSVRLTQAINSLNTAASSGGLITLGASASTALATVAGLGTALVTTAAGFGVTQIGAASTAVAILSASRALSTMTENIANLSRRLIMLGYLLAALRDSTRNLIPDQSIRRLSDFTVGARAITGAVQPASQALLTFQGAANSAGSTLGGKFSGAFQKLQGVWGTFTQGVRSAWSAVTGLGGGAGGAVPPINNFTSGLGGAGGAAGRAKPAVDDLTMSFFSLWRVLLALTVIHQVTSAIADSIDSWTMMSNKLRQVSTDSENLVATQEAVYQSAQKTRSGMEEMATLYSRTAAATKTLGLSQTEVMEITETVAMAMKLNGGSVQESANAMRQLSQAFNKGKLDGDEFRSIMENAPALQRVFTQALGVTTGELMRMSKAGELTLPKLIGALQKGGPAIRAAFGDTLPLITEGFTYLGNAVTRFLGQLNEATGFSLSFYNAMQFLGDNLGVLGVALAVVGTAIVVAFGPAAIASILGFAAAVAAALGPIALIAAAITGVVTAIYAWGDAWKVTADGITVLDYIRAALEIVGEYAGIAGQFIGDAFGKAWDWVKATWGQLTSFFGSNLDDVGSFMQNAVGVYYGLWIGLVDAIKEMWNSIPGFLKAIIQTAMNGVVQVTQDALNGIAEGLNYLLIRASLPLVPKVDLSEFKGEVDSAALGVGTKVMEAFNDGMNQGKALVDGVVTGLGAAADKLTARAREINRERLALEAGQPKLSTARGLNTFRADDSEAIKKRIKEQEALYKETLKNTLAQIKYYEALDAADDKASDNIREYIKDLNDQAFIIGATTEQVRDLTIQRKLEAEGIEAGTAAWVEFETQMRKAMDAKEIAQTHADALKESTKEWEKFTDQVKESLTDSIVRGLEDGKPAIKVFFDTLRRAALTAAIKIPVDLVVNAASGLAQSALASASGNVGGSIASQIATSLGLKAVGSSLTSTLFGTGTAGMIASGAGLAIAALGIARAAGIIGPKPTVGANAGGFLTESGGQFSIGGVGEDRNKGVSQLAAVQAVLDGSLEAINSFITGAGLLDKQIGDGVREAVQLFASGKDPINITVESLTKAMIPFVEGLTDAQRATIAATGGLDGLTAVMNEIAAQQALPAELAALRLSLENPKQSQINLLNIETEGLRERARALTDGTQALADIEWIYNFRLGEITAQFATGATDAIGDAVSSIDKEIASLQRQLENLTFTDLQIQARDLAELLSDDARAIQQTINATKAVTTAQDVLTQAYERESSALQTTIDKFANFSKSLKAFRDSLLTGNLSTLSPEEKYRAAAELFRETSALAATGDATAIEKMQGVSQAFLDLSRDYNASTAAYAADFQKVQDALTFSAGAAMTQADIAQMQLTALKTSVSELITINNSVLSVRDAITALQTAQAAQAVAQAGSRSVGTAVTRAGGAGSNNSNPSGLLVPTPGSAGDLAIRSGQTIGGVTFTNGTYVLAPPANSPSINTATTVANAYNAVGRSGFGTSTDTIDQAGFDYWTNALTSGTLSAADFQTAFLTAVIGTKGYDASFAIAQDALTSGIKLPGFASGSNVIPFDMIARIHKGEQIKPAAYVDLDRKEREKTNNLLQQVLTELRADKTQRGAVGTATLERLDAVADKLDATKRELARTG